MAKTKEHPDQAELPTMEREANPRIRAAAKAYRKVRDARMAATEDEVAGKEKLIEVMKAEGVEVYNDPKGFSVILNLKTGVKLVDDKTNGGNDDEE